MFLACMCVCSMAWFGDQGTIQRSLASPSVIQLLGIELSWSGLVIGLSGHLTGAPSSFCTCTLSLGINLMMNFYTSFLDDFFENANEHFTCISVCALVPAEAGRGCEFHKELLFQMYCELSCGC